MSKPRRHRRARTALSVLVLACLAACSHEEGQATAAGAARQPPTTIGARAPSAPASRQLPARRAVAGIAGFQSVSRIRFRADEDKPHTLKATFLFPERVRLHLALESAEASERVLAYRCGMRGFFVGPRASASEELDGQNFAALLLQTELRRALFLWPDGFAWTGDGLQRSVDLGDLGSLRAELGAEGWPSAMHSLDTQATTVESAREVRWMTAGKRQFPSHLELWAAGEQVWTEDVQQVETSLNYIDSFFLPPDRRALAEEAARGQVRPIDLSGAFECRVALPDPSAAAWTSALTAAEQARAKWIERGVEVLASDWLEVDAQARPRAVILRAERVADANAAAWTWRPETPAWSLVLNALTDLDPARLALLRAGCPKDPPPGVRLERVQGAAGPETFRLLALPGTP